VLDQYRVIDLTNERGLLCGQILADLGADVIQVEPPDGNSARTLGPWYKGQPGQEHSLFWWAYARNKRSMALDITQTDSSNQSDRDELIRLIRGADFFIESERPGRLAELGLGYDDLAKINPGLIYISITPFGQTGPKAQWYSSDLTEMAAGGHAYLSGDAEQSPVRLRVPQSHCHAGSDAAVAALIAHHSRRQNGLGQHIDISTQDSVTLATMFRALDAAVEEAPARRVSGGVLIVGAWISTRYKLKDGWVVLGPGILPSTGHFMKRLLTYALEDGFGDAASIEEDWGSFAIRIIVGELGADAFDSTDATLTAFFATKTKAEMIVAANQRKLLLAPVLGLDEIIESDQLLAREYSVEVHHPAVGVAARFPGFTARLTESPLSYRLPPPGFDQHGAEIRAEADRTPVSASIESRDVAETSDPAAGRARVKLPLEGVKILDLFWVLAGPGSTRMLADYGATVIHVESSTHVDTLRVIPPNRFANPHAEGSAAFQSANANKLGISVDIGSESGRALIEKLVAWADVVTESFAPGVVENYGLGYEDLRKINPEIIMISSCLMGQSGPWRNFTGFGNLAASVTGFQQLASWPGSPPSGPFGAYTDFIGVRYNAIAILAALEHREQTGQGQYIDQSQAEAGLHFLAPAFLDYTVNGNVQEAAGNLDFEMAPHDFYPTLGEDEWVAIAVKSDALWSGLCVLIERIDLRDQRMQKAVVDEALAAWTSQQEAAEVTRKLQALEIACHPASQTPALFEDPQLLSRGHYIEIEHEIYQTTHVESTRLKFSSAEAKTPLASISVGRDNRLVLEEILGLTSDEIDALEESGALS
jgi:crotonobetainyl-CoA:carnitine CoA-transferase CaiB-like acyl-CoA transferase